MKIAFTGLDLPEGKVKYQDRVFADLAEKFQPKKVTPHYLELMFDGYEAASAIAITADRLLDLLILDIEKIETRLSRAEDPTERSVLEKCLAHLENESPLCDMPMDEADFTIVKNLGPLSLKPTVVFDTSSMDPHDLSRTVMEKAGVMFFYTAGKQEVRAWLVDKGVDAVTCAAQIHTDLARGFIKAELVDYEDMMAAHSMSDARSKGLTKLVDRDHVIPENTVLEIRFNVS